MSPAVFLILSALVSKLLSFVSSSADGRVQSAHLIFNRLEPRDAGSLGFLTVGFPAVLSVVLRPQGVSILSSVLSSYAVYLSSLVLSVVVYRISPFHPLAKYPGPLFLKISRFSAWVVVMGGNQHRYYHSLHQRYGPYVRTGKILLLSAVDHG